ncbi:MAG: hypothetical protein ACFB15_19775 [Cyclobacteriaceae bacterium]
MCRKQLIEALKASKKSECFDNSTVAEENGKKFHLENKSKKTICRVKVDGCLIDNQRTKRCDYWFKICETEQHFLVELKGTDVSKAVEQIISTFDFVNRKLELSPERFEGIIVSSAVPKAEQKFRALKVKIPKRKRIKN